MDTSAKIETVFDDEQQHVGEVYAKALIGAATTAGSLEVVIDQLHSLVEDVFKKKPEFEMALSSPSVSQEQKNALLDRVFSNRIDVTLLRFLKILCRRNRLGSIRSIEEAASRMRDEALGRVRVTVVTASPISAAELTALEEKLSKTFNAKVSLTAQVDPKILGGLVIRIGDTVYDGSIDGRLQQLKKVAASKAEQTIREKIDTLAT